MSICSLIPPATAISKTQEPIKHTNEYIQSFFDWKLLSATKTRVQCWNGCFHNLICSKGNNSKHMRAGVMFLCSAHPIIALHLYEFSWKYLKRFLSYSADTSVWWKWPFSISFIIYYVQWAIIKEVCKPELCFLCSAHPIIVLHICMKSHENISNNF